MISFKYWKLGLQTEIVLGDMDFKMMHKYTKKFFVNEKEFPWTVVPMPFHEKICFGGENRNKISAR